MQIHLRQAAAAMLAGMTLLAGQPLTANAADNTPKKIVVIGDGVSSGALLYNRSRSYAGIIGRYYGAEVTDFSKDACTTEDMLAELDDPTVQAALAEADMILFTVGIQDITDPFFEQLAVYQAELGFEDISDMYTAARKTVTISDDTLTAYSLKLQKALESNEISCRDNILKIGEKLSVYSDAEIICPNVYNCLNSIENLESQSLKRQSAYKSIMNPGGWVLTDSVNVAYDTLAEKYGFTVIDTYNGFLGTAYKHTNLLQMDENPTAAGHLWIAQQITGDSLAKYAIVPGDMTADGAVTADDAAELLITAAKIGAGQKELLTADLRTYGDVDQNGDVSAADAASILQYAAATGAGEQITPEEFFKSTK